MSDDWPANQTGDDRPTQRLDSQSPDLPQGQGTRQIDTTITGPDGQQWIRREQAAGHAHAQSLVCAECGGEMIWATLVSPARIVIAALYAGGQYGKNASGIASLVCTNCGFTKFYTMEPRHLLE